MVESKGLVMVPPAFLMILTSPLRMPRAAGRSSTRRVSMQVTMAMRLSGYLEVSYLRYSPDSTKRRLWRRISSIMGMGDKVLFEFAVDADAFAYVEGEGGDEAGVFAVVADVVAFGAEEVEDEEGCVDGCACTRGGESFFDDDVESGDVDDQ